MKNRLYRFTTRKGLNRMQDRLDKNKEEILIINEEDELELEEYYYKLWEDDRL
jgi:hypothetical protein